MADNRAVLKAAIKPALLAAVGVDDNFDTLSEELSDAYADYSLDLVPTGTAGGDALIDGALE